MPWQQVTRPSIQLGTLEAIASAFNFPVTPKSLFLDFLCFASSSTKEDTSPIVIDDYRQISEISWHTGLGDWIFAVPPFRELSEDDIKRYAHLLREYRQESLLPKAMRLRDLVPEYLERACADILQDRPDAVGFTSTFSQNVPSLVLSRMIKDRCPSVKIVFGGANCDGPMGAGLHKAFEWIDYVLRGEAEYTFPALLGCIQKGVEPIGVPGAIYRDKEGSSIVNGTTSSAAVNMDDVPAPSYDEYFERLENSSLRSLRSNIALPVESARGCWWGDKHQCTFCGLNGSTISFRSKSAEKFQAEVLHLARKYRLVNFQAVDNILDMRYFKTFLPALKRSREAGEDLTFFYETKANLKKEHIALLHDAGVSAIQPGIESLNTHVLTLMDKGVTTLQNLRLLKWAEEYGIRVVWNLLCGFPGETSRDYHAILNLLPSITHLPPASGVFRLLLERFSPYFEKAKDYGINILGPAEFYEHVYPLRGDDLYQVAYDFSYTTPTADDEIEKQAYVSQINQAVRNIWFDKGRPKGVLSYHRGPGFIVIRDRRPTLPTQDYTFGGVAAELYLACDGGSTVVQLTNIFETFGYSSESIKAVLDTWVANRLMFEEDGQYLSLAVAGRPSLTFAVSNRSPMENKD